MSEYHLTCAVKDPVEPAAATIVWLHGLGAPWDFVDFPRELDLPEDLPVRWVFPQAPVIGVTINGGFEMPAWYDVYGLTAGTKQDEPGILGNSARIRAVLDREVAAGMPAERILLGGFSQGGALSLFTGLRYPHRLAGIVALSAYMLLETVVAEEAAEANRGIQIFQAHGTRDPMVPFASGQGTAEGLAKGGYPVEWHEYDMEHSMHPDEVTHLNDWLTARLRAL